MDDCPDVHGDFPLPSVPDAGGGSWGELERSYLHRKYSAVLGVKAGGFGCHSGL